MSDSSSGRARSSSSESVTSSLMRTMMISWTSSPVALGREDGRSGRHLCGDPSERVLGQGDVEFGEPAVGAHVVDHRRVRLVEGRVARPGLGVGDHCVDGRRRCPRGRLRRAPRPPGRSPPGPRLRTPPRRRVRLHRTPQRPCAAEPSAGGAASVPAAGRVGRWLGGRRRWRRRRRWPASLAAAATRSSLGSGRLLMYASRPMLAHLFAVQTTASESSQTGQLLLAGDRQHRIGVHAALPRPKASDRARR